MKNNKKNKVKICKLCNTAVDKHFSKFGFFGIYLGCYFSHKSKDSKKKPISDSKTF